MDYDSYEAVKRLLNDDDDEGEQDNDLATQPADFDKTNGSTDETNDMITDLHRMPKPGDEVRVSLRARARDGSVMEEKPPMDYEVGSNDLGPISNEAEKIIVGMKVGEEGTITCGAASADGAHLTMMLDEIYAPYENISFAEDKAVFKRQLRRGKGWSHMPKDSAKVTLAVTAATNGSEPLVAFQATTLEFVLGNGEVCDVFELAASVMSLGERAALKVTRPSMATEHHLGLEKITAERVVFTVELVYFETVPDPYGMSATDLLNYACARKEIGTNLFKNGRFQLALQRYSSIADLLSVDKMFEGHQEEVKAMELLRVCELNKAACFLKLKVYNGAKAACDAVLKLDSKNVKALYRRAQAELGLENFPECARDCKQVILIDASNRDARSLLKQAQDAHKKSKGFFDGMSKAFEKGLPFDYENEPVGASESKFDKAPDWNRIADQVTGESPVSAALSV